jgi:hypothetical protein
LPAGYRESWRRHRQRALWRTPRSCWLPRRAIALPTARHSKLGCIAW